MVITFHLSPMPVHCWGVWRKDKEVVPSPDNPYLAQVSSGDRPDVGMLAADGDLRSQVSDILQAFSGCLFCRQTDSK